MDSLASSTGALNSQLQSINSQYNAQRYAVSACALVVFSGGIAVFTLYWGSLAMAATGTSVCAAGVMGGVVAKDQATKSYLTKMQELKGRVQKMDSQTAPSKPLEKPQSPVDVPTEGNLPPPTAPLPVPMPEAPKEPVVPPQPKVPTTLKELPKEFDPDAVEVLLPIVRNEKEAFFAFVQKNPSYQNVVVVEALSRELPQQELNALIKKISSGICLSRIEKPTFAQKLVLFLVKPFTSAQESRMLGKLTEIYEMDINDVTTALPEKFTLEDQLVFLDFLRKNKSYITIELFEVLERKGIKADDLAEFATLLVEKNQTQTETQKKLLVRMAKVQCISLPENTYGRMKLESYVRNNQ